jgi:hypothetical protein
MLWSLACSVAALAQTEPGNAKRRAVPGGAPTAPVAPAAAPAIASDRTGTAANSGQGKALSQAFARAGVVTCGPRVEQIGDFLLKQAEVGAFLFLPLSAQDQRQVGVALEVAAPGGGPSVFASAEFSPEPGGGCGASYESISYWPVACAELARTTFAANKPLGVLKRNIQTLELSELGRVFLMPAGAGCVLIKRELLR